MAAAAGYAHDRWQAASDADKRVSPSAERNKAAIAAALAPILPAHGTVLTVAEGTGQHVSHFAAQLSLQLTWQPSDLTQELFASIAAWCAGQANVRPPLCIDASQPVAAWPVQGPLAAVLACNVTHIAPWRVTLGLVAAAGALLERGGLLCIYGPFKLQGEFTTDSNRQFHDSLVSQDPEWGYRDVADVTAAAVEAGLAPEASSPLPMPANNFLLVFRKA